MVEYSLYLFDYFNLLSASWKLELLLVCLIVGFILIPVLAEAVGNISAWSERFLPKFIWLGTVYSLALLVVAYGIIILMFSLSYVIIFVEGVNIWLIY